MSERYSETCSTCRRDDMPIRVIEGERVCRDHWPACPIWGCKGKITEGGYCDVCGEGLMYGETLEHEECMEDE